MKLLSEEIKSHIPGSDEDKLCFGYAYGGKITWFEEARLLSEIGCEYCPGLKMYSCLDPDNDFKRVAFCYDENCPRPRSRIEKTNLINALEWEKFGFPETHRGKTIKNYTFSSEESLQKCRDFLGHDHWSLWVFGGQTGSGKTHLSRGLAIQNYHTYGKKPVFVWHSTLYYEFKEASKNSTEEKLVAKYLFPDFLVIDDVGIAYSTDYEKVMFYDVVAKRMASMKKTIITTNLSKVQFCHENMYGERMKQRIADNGRWTNFAKRTETPSIELKSKVAMSIPIASRGDEFGAF